MVRGRLRKCGQPSEDGSRKNTEEDVGGEGDGHDSKIRAKRKLEKPNTWPSDFIILFFNADVNEDLLRYLSPVNPAIFPHLTVILLGIGVFFTAWFFVYEVTSTKFTRDLFKEFLVSLVAAIFSGFGILYLLLWVGIYV